MRNNTWKLLPIVFAATLLSFLVQPFAQTSSSVEEKLIKELNGKICADPSLADKLLKVESPSTAASGNSPAAKDTPNPSKLDAGACADCDVKSATAATKPSNPKLGST